MFQSIKQLYGVKLGASDGDIGHVMDFYFDEQDWTVRYMVVDTGSWLPGRQALISPQALANFNGIGKTWGVNLSRKQIEEDSSTNAHLRSTKAVNGFHLQASNGLMGHVCDFMLDLESWAICRLVIKTGHRLSGKEVEIPSKNIIRINYATSTLIGSLTGEAVVQSPIHNPHPLLEAA